MSPFEAIDIYCERTDPGFWSEPLNLLSNLGFIIAGAAILKTIKSGHYRSTPPGATSLGWMAILIGIGSGLFHGFANAWSQWADIIPIALFVFSYLALFLRFIAGASKPMTVLILTGFVALSLAVAKVSDHDLANGSEAYFGTWITLFGISCFYAGRKQALNQRQMALATALFSASLFLRTIDLKLCDVWPMGTHAFWHLLNASVIYLITSAYVTEKRHF